MNDPFALLGIPPTADDETVRHAYFEGLKKHPPDRDPEGFKRLRAAFDQVKDEENRLRLSLEWDFSPPTPEDLLASFQAQRLPAGPGPWLALIGEARKGKRQ